MTNRIHVSGVTSRGLVRGRNEDRASVDGVRLSNERLFDSMLDGRAHALLVADGMGGHARGEVASEIALAALEARSQELHDKSACAKALEEANRAVFDTATSDPNLNGMGTTIVGVAIQDQQCLWFNVGDSRAYLYRAGALSQLSKDHVPLQEWVTGTRSHAVTQSLGGTHLPSAVVPAIGEFVLLAHDRLLLCSDGMTDLLEDDAIAALFGRQSGLKLVGDLLAECLSRGAPDNVTLLLAELS